MEAPLPRTLGFLRAAACQVAIGGFASAAPSAGDDAVDFIRDVAPLFERACHKCHGPERQRSDFRLDVKAAALAGGSIGGAIVPGDSAKSRLIDYVAATDAEIRMPPKGELLTAAEVALLRRWIDEGASWPESADPATGASTPAAPHWAYQPIASPTLPRVVHSHLIRTPIDAFVLARLDREGLRPAPRADRRTLLRRATFDLTGLPPTPDELAAFLADDQGHAWERAVDRLLASPRYGERQARRWMDLVHFAETHGNDQDRPRPHAWPYRDWLIAAFNGDKPYARFVEEQLAGDVLFPDDPAAIAALGFLAAGPWDESSQLNILEETVDKQQARNLDRDDMVTSTLSTFVSTTVHCARCHDHKFDPISQVEYYGLQAVFAGIDRADRPFDRDPALHVKRQALLARKLAIEVAPADVARIADAAAQRATTASRDLVEQDDSSLQLDLERWEQAVAGAGAPWSVIAPDACDPAGIVSAGGQTATRQPDGSLLFGGALPETDTVTIRARAPAGAITALRLDVLADEALPVRGPGRQDNGNLHLSEITLQVMRAASPVAPVALADGSADFDQVGWTSAMAIDGKPETAWGVFPQIGRSHHAVFELAEPLVAAGDETLVVTLAQLHGGHHLIGRLRLAVTGVTRPVRATTLPAPVAAILAIAPAQRSSEQQGELARHLLLCRVGAELAALPPPDLVYAGTTDFTPENNFTPARGPRPVRLLARGEITRPGALVEPGALACVVGLPSRLVPAEAEAGGELDPRREGARRAALARWITDPRNSLTWRSLVNRVWQHHFGRGLVATPSDFGAMGAAPSHPELLDWLATWFRDGGGSWKALDRLIVTSEVWMQSTRLDEHAAAQDADNALLWRMSRTRLDAESIRDSLLQVAGRLDLTMGGPSVKQFIESPGIHVTPKVDYDAFDVDSPASCRRSIYRFLFRTLADPFMESMDCPDASQLAPTRSSSVTALQALSLLNDRFVVRMSERVAGNVAGAAGASREAAITALFRQVLLRPPSAAELAAFTPFVAEHGLANATRLLFNCSEFLFVD